MENTEEKKQEYKDQNIFCLDKLIRIDVHYEKTSTAFIYKQGVRFLGIRIRKEGLYESIGLSSWGYIPENEILQKLQEQDSKLKGSLSYTKLKGVLKDEDFYPVLRKAKLVLRFQNDFIHTNVFNSNEELSKRFNEVEREIKSPLLILTNEK